MQKLVVNEVVSAVKAMRSRGWAVDCGFVTGSLVAAVGVRGVGGVEIIDERDGTVAVAGEVVPLDEVSLRIDMIVNAMLMDA